MKVSKCKNNGVPTWRVNFSEHGKQVRKFFKTQKDANDFAAMLGVRLEYHDELWHRMQPSERRDLMLAWSKSRELGFALIDAVNAFKSQRDRIKAQLVSEAVAACLESKKGQGLRSRSFKKLKFTFEKLSETIGAMNCNDVTPGHVEAWLNSGGWSPATRKSYRTDAQTLFNFAKGRGWCDGNPVDAVPVPLQDDKAPGILSVDQCRKLLECCAKNDAGMVGYFALSLFAGIRSDEVKRMTIDNVKLDESFAEVPSHAAKTRSRRIVRLSENCVAWCSVGLELPIKNWRKRFDRVRVLANIGDWPHNAMRHTFASHHLAAHGSADLSATELGHHSTDMLFKHYRELVKPSDGEAFFKILPLASVAS